MGKIIFASLLYCFSMFAAALEAGDTETRHWWAELAAGPRLNAIKLKTATGSSGWSLGSTSYYYNYDPDYSLFGGDTYYTKDSQERFDNHVSEVSVMKFVRNNSRHFYADAGIGVGYMHGAVASNCKAGSLAGGYSGFLNTVNLCDRERVNGLSIPVEVNLAFGHYLGLGVTLRTSLATTMPGFEVGIIIPIGGFTSGNY